MISNRRGNSQGESLDAKASTKNNYYAAARQVIGKARPKVQNDFPRNENQRENNTITTEPKGHQIANLKENRGTKRAHQPDVTSDGVLTPVKKTNLRSKLVLKKQGEGELARGDRIHEDWLDWGD